ncbi:3-oxoacyl-ACP synthase [Marinifilum sp. N1E240]|uniref:3-oxoacyl-ACP synthase n=1 Tax=Marinifilum sp. N1E240 TaxID=2608082 RepID=UPI00128C0C1D|nr:3-oxoacyl-ACP synthase [Marinifilum sp. N1E240]MPQ48282.1 3-oxoacyl-ACP synthase [Marinifilum sp. N1E240]
MNTDLKKELYQLAGEGLTYRIEENKKALADLKESVGSESKSTAGDKHETGRAMMHLEQEKVNRQLQNNLKLRKVFDRLSPEEQMNKVGLGALVITDKIRFYIMAALGQYTLDKNKYYFISMNSEIAKAFLGAKKGDEIQFKGEHYQIKDVI